MKKTISLLVIMVLIIGGKKSSVSISNLRCEYLTDPIGIDVTEPRLSCSNESKVNNKDTTEIVINAVDDDVF